MSSRSKHVLFRFYRRYIHAHSPGAGARAGGRADAYACVKRTILPGK